MNPAPKKPEPETFNVEVMPQSAAVLSGEVDIQVATARRFPRQMDRVKASMKSMATCDQKTAEGCIYSLPRAGKNIAGPSIRLAEIVATCYGNMRVQASPIAEDATSVTVRGTAWDMENNFAVQEDIRRRITDSKGRRYNEDMIAVTVAAASSLAFRNSVFRVVPKVITNEIYDAARLAAVGNQQSIVERRTLAMAHFAKRGVPAARVLARLQIESETEITLEHLEFLVGIRNALHDGATSLEDEFPEVKATTQQAKPQPPPAAPSPPPAPVPPPADDPPLGPDGAAEKARLWQLGKDLGLRAEDCDSIRNKLGLGRDPGEWPVSVAQDLETEIREQAAGGAR